jgi:hypothetical protein
MLKTMLQRLRCQVGQKDEEMTEQNDAGKLIEGCIIAERSGTM